MNNDLISRSELKKALRQRQWHIDDIEEVEKIIDNAPTITPFALVEYETIREYERPHGEWLKNRVAFHFTCNYCGCNIRQLKSEVFEGNYNYIFCPNCGAQMDGGAS